MVNHIFYVKPLAMVNKNSRVNYITIYLIINYESVTKIDLQRVLNSIGKLLPFIIE